MQRELEINSKSILIDQDPKLGLGGSVWDAALVLSYALANRKVFPEQYWRNKRVIELGSGTGVCGIVAASIGELQELILTDLPKFLPIIDANIKLNQVNQIFYSGTRITSMNLDWSNFGNNSHLKPPFDIILCSDLVYEENTYRILIDTLCSLSNTETLILMSYEKRKKRELKFWSELAKRFTYKVLDKSLLDETYQTPEIAIFEIHKKSDEEIKLNKTESYNQLTVEGQFLHEYQNDDKYVKKDEEEKKADNSNQPQETKSVKAPATDKVASSVARVAKIIGNTHAKYGLPIKKSILIEDLKRLGVTAGMNLIVQSSLNSIGFVLGGALTVVEALLEVLTPSGTLIMPGFTTDNTEPANWENPSVPNHWFPIIRDNTPAHNEFTSRPSHDMGAIPNCFFLFPNISRSNHPSFSILAKGKNQYILTKSSPIEIEPLTLVYELNEPTYILQIGTDKNSSLHIAENKTNNPIKIQLGSSIENKEKKQEWINWLAVDSNGDGFDEIQNVFRNDPNHKQYTKSNLIGLSTSYLMDQKPIVDFAINYLNQSPQIMLPLSDKESNTKEHRQQYLVRNTDQKYNSPITKAILIKELKEMGIKAGMNLIVHSSLKSLGWIVGGGITVVEALLEVLTNEGTLIMPAFTAENSNPIIWENPPVPKEWHNFMKQNLPPFNVRLSPPDRGLGEIVHSFFVFPDISRSNHPTYSIIAKGKNQYQVTKSDKLDRQPINLVYELDEPAYILQIGTQRNSSLHIAEERISSHKPALIQHGAAIEVNGERKWAEWTGPDYDNTDFERVQKEFRCKENEEYFKITQLGLATCYLTQQKALVDFAVKWMNEHRPDSLEE